MGSQNISVFFEPYFCGQLFRKDCSELLKDQINFNDIVVVRQVSQKIFPICNSSL